MKIFNKNFFLGVAVGIVITILVIVVGGYLFIWWYSSGRMASTGKLIEESLEVPPFPEETQANYDWTVRSLNGEDFKMSDTKGKVVFLNFWATWCPPCVGEMPSIQRLYEKLKDEEVVFVCVSQEDSSKVSRFIKEKGFTFPIYTMKGAPPAVFNTQGIPATFILTSEGKVAFRHVGGAKWDDEKTVDFIRRQQP